MNDPTGGSFPAWIVSLVSALAGVIADRLLSAWQDKKRRHEKLVDERAQRDFTTMERVALLLNKWASEMQEFLVSGETTYREVETTGKTVVSSTMDRSESDFGEIRFLLSMSFPDLIESGLELQRYDLECRSFVIAIISAAVHSPKKLLKKSGSSIHEEAVERHQKVGRDVRMFICRMQESYNDRYPDRPVGSKDFGTKKNVAPE